MARGVPDDPDREGIREEPVRRPRMPEPNVDDDSPPDIERRDRSVLLFTLFVLAVWVVIAALFVFLRAIEDNPRGPGGL